MGSDRSGNAYSCCIIHVQNMIQNRQKLHFRLEFSSFQNLFRKCLKQAQKAVSDIRGELLRPFYITIEKKNLKTTAGSGVISRFALDLCRNFLHSIIFTSIFDQSFLKKLKSFGRKWNCYPIHTRFNGSTNVLISFWCKISGN